MKRLSWFVLMLCVAMLAPARASRAQASIYVLGSADYLKGGPYADFVYGGNAGVLMDLLPVFHGHATFSAALQGTITYNTSEPSTGNFNSPGEGFYAVTLGPRLSLPPHFFKLAPYVQFNAGFARYNDPNVHSTTDILLGGGGGVTRRLNSRFDGVVDYSYSYFGYNNGYYSPQAFSAGIVYHFVKR